MNIAESKRAELTISATDKTTDSSEKTREKSREKSREKTREKTREKSREKTREKSREKTREKIIQAVKENPVITTNSLAETPRITVKGVEWQIKDLKSRGIIRRVGPANGGHWEIIEN